jgi:hypothetical protein
MLPKTGDALETQSFSLISHTKKTRMSTDECFKRHELVSTAGICRRLFARDPWVGYNHGTRSPPWGCSSVGRAPRSQRGGQRFDPAQLHHRIKTPGQIDPLDPLARVCEREQSAFCRIAWSVSGGASRIARGVSPVKHGRWNEAGSQEKEETQSTPPVFTLPGATLACFPTLRLSVSSHTAVE